MARFAGFNDPAIGFNVILRACESVEQYKLRHEFIKCIHGRYAAGGIEIPFPIRTVHFKERKLEK